MTKSIRWVITPGIQEHVEERKLNHFTMNALIQSATRHFPTSYFLVAKPIGNQTEISDGNNNVLEVVSTSIPEKIYLIQDDYEDHFVGTILLPEEY